MAAVASLQQVGSSSFGMQDTTWGPESMWNARCVLGTQRFQELDRKQSYYEGTQHDFKSWDFDGRPIARGGGVLTAMSPVGNEVAAWFVPLRSRRPSSPYRLPKVIVDAFTNMTFGSQRFPGIRIEGDPDTQDYMSAMARAQQLSKKMVAARNIGGSVGTTALSWCFDERGKPRCEVHNGKYLWVHKWEDREELIIEHVSEVYIHARDEWDSKKRQFLRNWYWHRRDWMKNADITFLDTKFEPGKDPVWIPDVSRSTIHNDGEAHFFWIQNLPSEDIDGLSDYEGLWESFDALDLLYSVILRGAALNLDPTVVLNLDPEEFRLGGLQKGSENALAVGEKGDAKYMELAGTSLQTGITIFQSKRASTLEAAQCVVADPDKVAAQGLSSVSQKLMYGPMLGKTDVLREQYGTPMKRMLDQQQRIARASDGASIQVIVQLEDGTYEEQDAVQVVNLSPRIVRTPATNEADGTPVLDPVTGVQLEKVERIPRKIGEGGETDLMWGAYFPPTPDDQSKTVTTLSTASGGKAVISQQTAVELTAVAFGHEPDEEWQRVQKMRDADDEQEIAKAQAEAAIHANMLNAGVDPAVAGGEVDEEDALPEGAAKKPPPKAFGQQKPPDPENEKPLKPPGKPGFPFKKKPPAV